MRLLAGGFFKRIVNAEARRLLPLRERLKRLEVLANDCLCGYQDERAIGPPLVVKHGCVVVRALEGVAAHVEYLGRSQPDKTFPPDTQTHSPLLQEMNLPLINAQRHQVAVVAPVQKSPARVLFHFSLEERQQVIAI